MFKVASVMYLLFFVVSVSSYRAEALYIVQQKLPQSQALFRAKDAMLTYENPTHKYSFSYAGGLHVDARYNDRSVNVYDSMSGSEVLFGITKYGTGDDEKIISHALKMTTLQQGKVSMRERYVAGMKARELSLSDENGARNIYMLIPDAHMVIAGERISGLREVRFETMLATLDFGKEEKEE